MASRYADPYRDTSNNTASQGQPYGGPDSYTTGYPHQTYDNMGPTHEQFPSQANFYDDSGNGKDKVTFAPQQYPEGGFAPPASRQRSMKRSGSKKSTPSITVSPVRKVWNGFEHGEFTPTTPRANRKSLRSLKEYRYDNQGNLWTKGGRGRCIGRFFCCTIMVIVLLLLSIIFSLALWIRPPNVSVGGVTTQNTTGSLGSPDGLAINLNVNISVNNPNYFSVDLSTIKAEIFYPIKNTPIGGGEARNVRFPSHALTNWTFPFALQYKSSLDPGSAVLSDLGAKCGFGGSQRGDITVDYKITLGIRILVVTISPVISNKFTFTCPASLAGAGVPGGVIPGTTS